jgi:hypothetical protein
LVAEGERPLRARGLASSRTTYLALSALAIALGAGLRLLGYFDPDLQLWLDEASWAMTLVDGTYEWIRPIGYMELTRALVGVVNNEQTLRSLSLLGGLAHVPLTLVALRLSTSSRWIALFGAYLVAVHPTAIAMSKEFKPYGLELSIHLLLICLALAYLRTDRLRYVLALVGAAVVAPLFSWSVVVIYPAVFAVVGIRALRGRRISDFVLAAGGAGVTLAVLAVIWLARISGEDANSEYWGDKYDVFYVGGSRAAEAAWLARKTLDVAAFPASVDVAVLTGSREAAAVAAVGIVSIGLCVIGGLSLLARRRWALAAIWIGPWAVVLALNVLGLWPWGVFRTNLFMLAYAIGLLCHGLLALGDRISALGAIPRRSAALGLALVALAAFPLNASSFATKPGSTGAITSSVRTAMERIYAIDGGSESRAQQTIALDTHACYIFRYYAEDHAESKRTFSTFFASPRYKAACAPGGTRPEQWTAHLNNRGPFQWVLSAKPSFVPVTRNVARESCEAAGGRVDVYEELPAGTVLTRCLTEPGGAAEGAG